MPEIGSPYILKIVHKNRLFLSIDNLLIAVSVPRQKGLKNSKMMLEQTAGQEVADTANKYQIWEESWEAPPPTKS